VVLILYKKIRGDFNMDKTRKIKKITRSEPTIEGAGVRLKRAFGYSDPDLDPFLLLDDFHSKNPEDYVAGFPWHPHRGIETITYMLLGEVSHGDSMGNKGVIQHGDVQWMTAGSGIVHEEMPHQSNGELWGFQLWANLPSHHKMMHPRYRDIKKEKIPEVSLDNKVNVKIICGDVNGVKGPVQDIITEPEYLDVSIEPHSEFTHGIKRGHNAFAYVIDGEGYFDEGVDQPIKSEFLVVYEDGDRVTIKTEDEPVRFLLISGKPLGESVAWYGPIVMNTQEELEQAFKEYQNGTFIKHK
jgi:redox-sensitive bicupin YhaK (pirin superfamily)